MERPRQAVILAGGRGRRLGALTARVPKPMLEIAGRPFLEHLLGLMRAQGFERVLLLLGYLADVIRAELGDGSRFGLELDYFVSDPDDETGRRLQGALDQLESRFLLAYCDNYWPMPFSSLWDAYCRSGARAQITAYRNRDGYTRNNLRIGADGLVELYDRSRQAPGLAGVDIGFMILERDVVSLLPAGENLSFEAFVLPRLVAQRQLAAFATDHRYYSIGSPERLAETERFFAARPTVLLDRDGVLNAKPPRATYVRSWQDWSWMPRAKDALRLFHERGWRVAVVTNQAGVARGELSAAELDEIHARMCAEAEAAGGRIDVVYHCPHGWDEGCECRKPAAGMLFRAQRELALDLSRTPFVGDDERDAEAAARAGCRFIPIQERATLMDIAQELVQ